jgi:hypothetical protein
VQVQPGTDTARPARDGAAAWPDTARCGAVRPGPAWRGAAGAGEGAGRTKLLPIL